jgi:hypothetical protein
MLLGWLLPDASYTELCDGWQRTAYRPRHGKPPLAIRGAHRAATVIGTVRERYLGAAEDDVRPAVWLTDTPRGPRMNLPRSG